MIIYCTTNIINGKKYIGLDRRNNPNYLGSGKRIKQAILKYGKQNFKKQILQYCETIEDLRESEIYWIQYFNAVKSDLFYNIHEGGSDGSSLPSFKGIKQSKEHIQNRRLKQIGKLHPLNKLACSYCNHITTNTNIVQYHNENCLNRYLTEGEKAIVIKRRKLNHLRTQIHTDKLKQLSSKKIVQLNSITLEPIKEYSSLNEAVKFLGLKNASGISSVIHNRQKQSAGYKWTLKN